MITQLLIDFESSCHDLHHEKRMVPRHTEYLPGAPSCIYTHSSFLQDAHSSWSTALLNFFYGAPSCIYTPPSSVHGAPGVIHGATDLYVLSRRDLRDQYEKPPGTLVRVHDNNTAISYLSACSTGYAPLACTSLGGNNRCWPERGCLHCD